MSLTKENKEGNGRILLIFCKNACLRRTLPAPLEERSRLILASPDTGLLEDVAVELSFFNGYWHIGERELSDKAPFHFYTEKNEKLLFLLSGKMRLKPSGRVLLQREERVKIGSAFKNSIFFECFSLVGRIHAEICVNEQGAVIENPGNEGIYVNERALTGRRLLRCGDRVDIYGLHLLILQEIIVCVAFCGICRVTDKSVIEKVRVCTGRMSVSSGNQQAEESGRAERIHGQEEPLHTGEVEILLPEIHSAEHRQPLFLSMGPTVTMVLPMLLMAWMMNHYMGERGGGFYYLSALMSGCSAMLALFWGFLGYGYQKYTGRREEKEKERQYREYLKGMEEELSFYQSENCRILKQKYPPLKFFLKSDTKTPVTLWNRYYRQNDFLFFRLGTGDQPFQVKIKLSGQAKSIVQRKLTGEAEKLAERFVSLREAPVGVNLYENRQVGIREDADGEGAFGVALSLIMQIAACHCYTEVKTVCFYHKDRSSEVKIADCFRWLPHSWSVDKRTRFLAGDEREAGEILPVLTRELMKNKEDKKEGVRIPWYVVFVFNEELIHGETLYRFLTEAEGVYPVSTVFVGKKKEEFPKCCQLLITEEGKGGEILKLDNENPERKKLTLEICGSWQALQYIRSISGLRVREMPEDGQLPERADFLQLYGCEKVEEIESGRRWRMSQTGERLKVPVGLGAASRPVYLDVHEKFHGPHGLVAGTTGSGKSELLQTYLLSIAVNFSPEDVNFFMIDYKGGGTGNLLKNLPHCAGIISNLSGKQIRRAMSAIASENRRRQQLLNDFQVNHIDAYTKLYREGKTSRAMPHLLLVVDEFAELKKEEPEFMREIISLSQVGRSLGVHLILATQKPAGTVDDKIWSNARFRLCLRVQDRQDSLDMLHSDEAASLTAPGQCYLQIGNHEYFELFQAAYCGGVYNEEAGERAKTVLLSDTGKRMEKKKEPEEGDCKSQIEVLTAYIRKTAKEGGYLSAPALWLPELPGRILLKELEKGQGTVLQAQSEKKIFIGLCDDPENQCSFTLAYQPRIQGHLAVCGGPATGKTTLLQTILWQFGTEFTTEEVLFLAVDMRQEGIGSFKAMPHCMGMLGEKEGLDVFFYHLEAAVNERKKILSGISFEQYNNSGKGKIPRIFLVIDNYGALKSLLDESREELIMKLASEGYSLGFILIMSAFNISDIGGKLYEKIRTTLSLEMSDRFQYGDVLRQYYIPVFPEENQKGRGLCKLEGRILEFQTALFDEKQTEYDCGKTIAEAGRKMSAIMEERGISLPERFPEIPAEPVFNRLAMDFDWESGNLPLGYCLMTGEICGIRPEKSRCFLISGGERCGKTNLLCCLIEGTLRQRSQAVILDFESRLEGFKEREGVTYLGGEEEMEGWRTENGSSEIGKNVFISDIGLFCTWLYRSGALKEERTAFWERAAAGDDRIGFLAGIYHLGRDYEAAGTGFFREFTAWRQGIHLGGNAASQRVLSFDDLSYTKQNQPEPPGIGYYRETAGSNTRRILLPIYAQAMSQEWASACTSDECCVNGAKAEWYGKLG